jgi:hypothetical protein
MKQKERCEKIHELSIHMMHLRKVMELLEEQKKDISKGCTHKLAYGQDALDTDGECQVCGYVVKLY